MIPWTTPTLTITIEGDADLTQAQDVLVTITQPQVYITKSLSGGGVSVTEKTVACWLSQEETRQLRRGSAQLQVNWTYTDAVTLELQRAATEPLEIEIGKQLYKQVIA